MPGTPTPDPEQPDPFVEQLRSRTEGQAFPMAVPASVVSNKSRRTLPVPVAYAGAAYIIGLGLFASVAPSPLYEEYMQRWDFSPLTLTVIFAMHSFGVLTTLLLAGSVSDVVGRRAVLLSALAMLMASTVLFIFATSIAWLLVARALQGLATGAAVSTASAALLDFAERRPSSVVSLTNTVATTAGAGLGILTVSALLHSERAPRVLPYLVLFALLAFASLWAYWMPEPVTDRGRLRLTVQWPRVPQVVRGPFLLASLAVVSSWSVGGLLLSLGPELGGLLFGSESPLVSCTGIVAALATASVSQVAWGRSAPWLGTTVGSLALAAGVLLIVLATVMSSSVVYLVGSVVGGFGFGVAFLSGLRGLVAVIPPDRRAAVLSAFYVVAYASLSVPAIVAGLVVGSLGLETTFEVFGVVAAVLALAAGLQAWRTRPPAARPGYPS